VVGKKIRKVGSIGRRTERELDEKERIGRAKKKNKRKTKFLWKSGSN
jgi:hypothetical protein